MRMIAAMVILDVFGTVVVLDCFVFSREAAAFVTDDDDDGDAVFDNAAVAAFDIFVFSGDDVAVLEMELELE
jgi:hypothetical protein